MKPIKQFQMGSTYFFSKYRDFKAKDYDDLCIMDRFIFKGNVMNMKLKDKDEYDTYEITIDDDEYDAELEPEDGAPDESQRTAADYGSLSF